MKISRTNPPLSKPAMSGWLAIIVAIGLVVLIVWILEDTKNDLVNNSWGLGTRNNWQIVAVFIGKIVGTVVFGMEVIALVHNRSSRILNAAVLLTLFGVAGVFILLYADVFRIFGLIDTVSNRHSEVHDPIIVVYFSAITWTTVGYGDFAPTESARLFAATEAFIGHVWMGLLIAILAWVFLTLRRE